MKINVIQNLKQIGLLISICGVSLTGWALQVVDVSDGRSHLVNISATELSRIAVDEGKIRRLDFIEGELEVKKDDAAGDYYILPLVQKPINVFVKSTSGLTHALILQPKDIPIESIVLKEPKSRVNNNAGAGPIERAGSLEQAVKNLILAMARNENSSEFDVISLNQEITLWNESKFILVSKYMGMSLVGEHYRLMNISKSEMRLAEQEFYKKDVVGISIENLVLNPGEYTDIFITKVNTDGSNF